MNIWHHDPHSADFTPLSDSGGARLLRSIKDITEIFKNAALFNPPEGTKTIEVDSNGYGIIGPQSEERFLMTYNVNVCSGIALASPDHDMFALMHIYSNRGHFLEGRERIEAHGVKAWEIFESLLPPDTQFKAIAFGGKDRLDEVPAEIPSIEEVKLWYTPSKTDPEKGTRSYELLGQAAVCASVWMADAFLDAACNSGRILHGTDVRYQYDRHHVVIDKETGEIYFGKVGDGLYKRIKTQTETRWGGYIFPNPKLHPEQQAPAIRQG